MEELKDALILYYSNANVENQQSQDEWTTLKAAMDILLPLYAATKEISGEICQHICFPPLKPSKRPAQSSEETLKSF